MPVNFYARYGKRLLDLGLVIPSLALLAPLLACVALLIRLRLGAPVLFRQQRPGLYGQPFTILKFRTMANAYDGDGHLLPDADRLTRLGRFLRRTSLDELPELINILKGEMSLVGPRPLLMRYLNRYDRAQMRRHEVRPGLTGWAQINGRNAVGWQRRLSLDVWYSEHHSLLLDIRILVMTTWKVITRDGITQPGHATMTEFMGNAENGSSSETRGDSPGTGKDATSSAKSTDTHSCHRSFTPEFKAGAVLELLTGVKRIDELCAEFELDPYLLARWQADFLENAAEVFRRNERQKD
jgi:lipopolysaccharide/colanic/teichoic acid biosynthesis glycosyltransferase